MAASKERVNVTFYCPLILSLLPAASQQPLLDIHGVFFFFFFFFV
jgi:hypothetical protein